MRKKWFFIILTTMIVITNLPIIDKNFMLLIDGPGKFRYSNADASYTRIQRFGFKDGSIIPTQIERFIEDNKPQPENKKLYRLYRINPLCFWRWSYYLFNCSKFKYKSWKEIEQNRVPYDSTNMWQDF